MFNRLLSSASRIAATLRACTAGPNTMSVDPKPMESLAHIEDDLNDPLHPDHADSYEQQCREEPVYGPDEEDIR